MNTNKCEFVGGGAAKSRKLLAAMAILAVAFVVLAAVPAALTDSDAENETPVGTFKYVVLEEVEGVKYYKSSSFTTTNEISGRVSVSEISGNTIFVEVQSGYKPSSMKFVVNTTEYDPDNDGYKFTVGASGTAIVTVTGVNAIVYEDVDVEADITASDSDETHNLVLEKSVSVTGTVAIDGKLTVPEGFTLTIDDGASLTVAIADIKGTVVVKDGGTLNLTDAEIDGTIAAEEGSTVSITKAQVDGNVTMNGALTVTGELIVNKTMTIGADGTAYTNEGKITVAEGAELTIEGKAKTSLAIYNKGTVVVDSEKTADAATQITMGSTSAVVTVDSYDGATSSYTLQITDNGATLAVVDGVEKKSSGSANTISVYTASGKTISGLTVTQNIWSTTTSGTTSYYSSLDISGEVTADAGAAAFINLSGGTKITVSKELEIGNDVTLTNSSGNLDISGSVDVTALADSTVTPNKAAAAMNATGTVNVIGTGVLKVCKSGGLTTATNVNAVYTLKMYEAPTPNAADEYTYMSLSNALKTVTSGTQLKMPGTINLEENATIADGVSLTIESGAKLTVKSGYTLTVAKGAKLNVANANTLDVKGTLIAESGSTVVSTGIDSEVKSVGPSTDAWTKWTTLENGLKTAASGETVTLNDASGVAVSKDLTIPAGIVLADTAACALTVSPGYTLTVDGVLYLENSTQPDVAGVATTAKGAIAVGDGMILSVKEYAYSAQEIAGAYYTYNYNGAAMYAISKLSTAVDSVAKIVSDSIDVYGEVSEDVTFTAGTYAKKITVPEAATNILKGTITLNSGSLVTDTGVFNGTIVGGTAKVTFNGSGLTASYTTAGGLVLSGTVASDSVLEITEGTVIAGISGEPGTPLTTTSAESFTVAEGATMQAVNFTTTGTLTIKGTVVVASGATFTPTTVDMKNASELNVSAGTVTTLNMYDQSQVTVGSGKTFTVTTLNAGASKTEVFEDAAPVVSGAVALTATTGVIYAGVDATIDAKTLAGTVANTSYYVGDDKFLTVYVVTSSSVTIGSTGGIQYTPVNGYFDKKWKDAKTGGSQVADAELITAHNGENVYGTVVTDLYIVQFVAPAGIANVFIDGVQMAKVAEGTITYGEGTYPGFELKYLAAGDHVVTIEYASGYSGTLKITLDASTVEGTSADGNVLTLGGAEFTADDDYEEIVGMLSLEGSSVITDGYVVVFDEDLVKVTADGEAIDSFAIVKKDAKIAIALNDNVEGTVKVNDEEYDGEFALTESVLITVEEELEPSEDITVYVASAGDGKVSVLLYANDGGYIPAGTCVIYVNYTYYDEDLGWVGDSDKITVTGFDGSDLIYDYTEQDISGAQHYSSMKNVNVSFTVGEGEDAVTYYSDFVQIATA